MLGIAHVERSVETRGRQQRTVTRFYGADGNVTASMSVTKTVKKKSGLPKKTPYNYKQLSTQLMRAHTSGAVSQVLIKMRNKRAQLISAKRGGEYDDTEIAQENEEYEEQLEEAADPLGLFGGEDENSRQLSEDEMEQILSDIEEEMDELMKEMEENAEMDEALEEMTEVFSGDLSPEDLEEMKKKHRAAEQRDIIKADMKYLKALFDKLSRDKEHAASASGSSSAGASAFSTQTATAQPMMAASSATASAPAPVASEGQVIDVSV